MNCCGQEWPTRHAYAGHRGARHANRAVVRRDPPRLVNVDAIPDHVLYVRLGRTIPSETVRRHLVVDRHTAGGAWRIQQALRP